MVVSVEFTFENVPQALRFVQYLGPNTQQPAPVRVQQDLISDVSGICNIDRHQVPGNRQRVSVCHTAQRARVRAYPAWVRIAAWLVLEALH